MNFWKKLVILTGKTGRGTAVIEQNGIGIFLTLNAFSLPDLTRGEYAVGIKTADRVLKRELGSLGGIKVRFALPDGNYDAVHLVLFTTRDDEVIMYGTTAERKLWEANLMDGFRGGRDESQTQDYEKIAATAQEFKYSQRKIEDWFLNIEPPKEYSDGALAEVNYYEPASSGYYSQAPKPSETVKSYLQRRFGNASEVIGLTEQAVNSASEHNETLKLYTTLNDLRAEGQRAAAQAASAQAAEVVSGQTAAGNNNQPQEPRKIKNASEYTVEQAIAAAKTGVGFYAAIKPQLDKLFEVGERFAPLERALPGTRWVKINFDDKGRYYAVGLIGAAPDYIAYAVEGKYNEHPISLEGADFIPIDDNNGFWALFQSAQTGEEIKKNKI